MKTKTKEKLSAIDAGHDWNEGQTWGGSGTQLSQTDTCDYCGLVRMWSSDRQNGDNGTTRFLDSSGDPMPLCEVPESCQ